MEILTRDELMGLVNQHAETIVRLTAEIGLLKDQIAQLQKEAARQAAPFRRQEKDKVPPEARKKSGRQAGHTGVNRPIPTHIDATEKVPLDACPKCQGAVVDVVERVQYVEEIPVVKPKVTKLLTYAGVCSCCGQKVESNHPLQTGHGSHASAVHLGPRALAFAALLNKHHGVTMRKTCRILNDGFGLSLSAGGLSQALDRLATRCDSDYQKLYADMRAGPAAHVDETSWWVSGPGYWLHVFTNPTTTLYRVEASRGSDVVTKTLTPDYAGVLISDCLNIYDSTPIVRKHKCIAHHQKAIRNQLDDPGLKDTTYLDKWKALFTLVCETTARKAWMSTETLEFARQLCQGKVDKLLAQVVTQPQDKKIQNRLAKQSNYLLTCLSDLAVEATNNRAERALRPAIIGRKVSCGNKTVKGKTTWERLASVIATLRQRGEDALKHLTHRATLVGEG
jgi:transposase